MMRDERFETGATAYADYLRTTEGRLRLDLAWANLRELLSEAQANQDKCALDVGGGTGALAVKLAVEDWRVSVVDASAAMLALAEDSAREAGVGKLITFQHAEAERAAELFSPHSFQLVVCHNVLEYVADPLATVCVLKQMLAKDGLLSIVARNRAGESLRAALKAHDLAAAEAMLTAEWATESLYGGQARLFDYRSLRKLLHEAGFEIVAERGVRVIADYLPSDFTATDETYAQLLAFERRYGALSEFAAVARYAQIVARKI